PAGPPPGPPPSGPPAPSKPSKVFKRATAALEELRANSALVNGYEARALASAAAMRSVKARVEEDIRTSAAEQYKRGVAGYVSVRSKMDKKKFYLGEIATTQPLTGGKKARGVLWAKP